VGNYFVTLDPASQETGIRNVYIATDSNTAIRESVPYSGNYSIYVDWTQKRFKEDRFNQDWQGAGLWLVPDQTASRTVYRNNLGVVGIIVDLWFMSNSKIHIGTSTSNVFGVVNSFRDYEGQWSSRWVHEQGKFQGQE